MVGWIYFGKYAFDNINNQTIMQYFHNMKTHWGNCNEIDLK